MAKKHPNKKSPIRLDWKTLLVLIILGIFTVFQPTPDQPGTDPDSTIISTDEIPEYQGQPYVELNGNLPDFEDYDADISPFEEYGAPDELGRRTQAVSCVSTELMPTQERGNISHIKPTGWQRAEYDFIDSGLLYNR